MWVPLHVHSQYSILDALASVEAIAEKASEFKMPAVALTDHGNLFGAVDFYKACKSAKVKPLIGCEVYVAPDSRFDKKKEYGAKSAYHLTLIAKNRAGYRNLCKLSSLGYTEGFYYHPRVDRGLLKELSLGLICLSGCLASRISETALKGKYEDLVNEILWHKEVYGEDFYLELQRHTMTEEAMQEDGMHLESWLLQQYRDFIQKQALVNSLLVRASNELGIKCVATNDSHYIERGDWRAHEVLLNIQSGEPCEIWEKDQFGNPKFKVANPKRRTYPSHECYFKSQVEMQRLFSDLPEALNNTLEVAEKCSLELDFTAKHYPVYIPPTLENRSHTHEEQAKAVEEFLWSLCREGIKKRYTEERLLKIREIYPEKDPMAVVEDRLAYEMSVIVPKGMSDYLLIVWDFINWAKTNGIPMGPGRGSGAGSIVLYLIGITDIEPLRFFLFFERFINPERISYPDIDVDICMDRRQDVINYVLSKYGKDNVAQIITFGTMKAKMSIKDVGRTLSVPLSKVNEIAKLVPEDLNITLEKALEKDPDLRRLSESDEEAHAVIEMAKVLEGCIRNTGIHAAGIIISGEVLTDLIPISTAKDSDMPVTQYSMKPVELVGMLKVDFLGLKTLTAIQLTCDQILASIGVQIDWVNLPLDDKKTFELLNQGKTLGVFQLESGGMQDLARHLHLDRFEEIIAVGALYRPGPMDMIPSFIDRKHGREPIDYDHPWMIEILSETYGIMVYQEQVMQIASKLANYSLGEGDVLRRAMGKKDIGEMHKQREKFRQGALQNDISEDVSMKIFDKMEKFASYGFNKSHAAAYGYLSYVTAYLKANYPKEWMAALMTCDSHDLTKVSKFIREAHAMGINILPPDINEAESNFVAVKEGIRFAMAGIKGIGQGVVDAILAERKKGGRYLSFYDFIHRQDAKKVGKKTLESLIDAGCFAFTGWTKDELKTSLDPIFEEVTREQKEKSLGFMDLFALGKEEENNRFKNPIKVQKERSRLELLLKEKELLGVFLTGHPLEAYAERLSRLSAIPFSKASELEHDAVFRAAFFVETVNIRLSNKTEKKFAILQVGDGFDSIELPIWSDLYEEKSALLKENALLYAVLQVNRREETVKYSCKFLDDLSEVDEKMIEASDLAYDRAKQQAKRIAYSKVQGGDSSEGKSKSAIKEKKKEENVSVEPFILKLSYHTLRLSHILKLKNLFSKHRGKTPVHLHFLDGEGKGAALEIPAKWGVTLSEEFKEEMTKFGF